MKPHLCAAGVTLRDQVNKAFPDRDKKSDGWIGDLRHQGTKSDHLPDYSANAIVRAIDLDKDFGGPANVSVYLADQIRVAAKTDRRINYVIFQGRIASRKSLYRWVRYRGINAHNHHLHISFTKKGDLEGSPFAIPLLGDI